MSKKLAVAMIHGMGNQTENEFAATVAEVKNKLGRQGVNIDQIAWQGIYWADVLNGRQRAYMEKATAQGAFKGVASSLVWNKLRAFVVGYLADVCAYQRVGPQTSCHGADSASGTYMKIHEIVRDGIAALHNEAGGDAPLVILAHSLGGQIVSNYIWDAQHKKSIAPGRDNDFELMHSLAGLVTFGCNIPLFTFAFDENDIKPIAFPGELHRGDARAKWLNIYDADDVLGYPLSVVKAYEKLKQQGLLEDWRINSGGLLASWNPLSHAAYWTDKEFIDLAAGLLKPWVE